MTEKKKRGRPQGYTKYGEPVSVRVQLKLTKLAAEWLKAKGNGVWVEQMARKK